MNTKLLWAAPWLVCGAMAPAWAQTSSTAASAESDTLEEIVITAERRPGDLQKTAASVAVRNGDEMISEGRLNLGDYLTDIAGINGTPSTASVYNPYANISIRGVISNSPGDGSQVPTTAVYSDGIYQGIGTNYDMDRVEVLRGPQGTLYGRSATGGVIATYSRDPKLGEVSGNAAATAGSYNLLNVQAAINLPLGEQLAFRFSGLSNKQDNYISDYPTWQRAGRMKMLYKPADNLSILVGVASQYDHVEAGGPAYNLETDPNKPVLVANPNPHTINKDHVWQYWLNVNWDMGWANLTYIPSYRRNYADPNESYVGPSGAPVGYNPSVTPKDEYLTHELRLASNADSSFKWIIGTFYYHSVWQNDAYLQWLASGALAWDQNQRKELQDVGLFGETTFDFSNTLRLTTGLRFDYNSSRHTETRTSNATGGAGPTSPTFGLPEDLTVYTLTPENGFLKHRNVTYKLRLEKDVSEGHLVYASVSSGFLPGDVQVAEQNNIPYRTAYDQEILTAFEVGSKNRFLDNRLQLNASAYYYDYSGYQVDVQPDPTSPGALHETKTSAATMLGIDLDVTYLLTRDDQINFTLGAIDAEFHSGDADFHKYVVQKHMTGIVPLTMSAAYEHTFNFGNGSALKARIDGQFNSAYDLLAINSGYDIAPYYFTAAEQKPYVHLGSETLGNASLNWNSPSGRYMVGGYVRNFANNVYKTNMTVQYNTTVPASPSIGRTVGGTVRVNF